MACAQTVWTKEPENKIDHCPHKSIAGSADFEPHAKRFQNGVLLWCSSIIATVVIVISLKNIII